jgi:predicted porin
MLSKRTNAYAGLINKTDTNAANVATKSNALVTGVRHDF